MRSLYTLFGCEETISAEELKQLYFDLLRQVHPDKSGTANFEQFLAINKAWETLSDRSSRRAYDSWLREQRIRESKELIGREVWVSPNDLVAEFDEDCRCGGTYEELLPETFERVLDYTLLECSNCSLCLRVWRIGGSVN